MTNKASYLAHLRGTVATKGVFPIAGYTPEINTGIYAEATLTDGPIARHQLHDSRGDVYHFDALVREAHNKKNQEEKRRH